MWLVETLLVLLIVSQVKSADEQSTKSEQPSSNESTTSKSTYFYVAVPIIFLLLVFAFLLIYHIQRRNRKTSSNKFGKGNPDKINENMTLEEQIDLLPYEKSYEYSRKKLKFGDQIGRGNYGEVRLATAPNIIPGEENSTVIVKMINKTHDKELFRVAYRELKIRVHLGKHLNLVNLLGADTRKLSNREVIIIEEYSPYGNLQTFLIEHRLQFIDQIVRGEDVIDPTITTKHIIQQRNNLYSHLNRPDDDPDSVFSNNSEDSNSDGFRTINSRATLCPTTSDLTGSTKNLDQLPSRTVTTTDLLCFAFQVARGMQYLASQKVLHGYLAAKNILLCNNNVVKICNFGSLRSIYTIDNYLHEDRQRSMPFKWLSPETIDKKVFSTSSDVWSFGIVLWEFFSLGTLPFMGIDDHYVLYRKFVDGYRLEKPHYSTSTVYNIMQACWRMNGELRPTFTDLEDRVYRLLDRNVANRFIDMNEPYLKSNVNQLNAGQKDYLKLLFVKMTSSGYVSMLPKTNVPCGYVEMNVNSKDSIV